MALVWWQLCILLLALAVFLAAFSASLYLAIRFASLVISIDLSLLREMRNPIRMQYPSILQSQVNSPPQEKTPGEPFVPYSDEVAFLNEKAEDLRRQGLNEDDLQAFMRQAVGSNIGEESK